MLKFEFLCFIKKKLEKKIPKAESSQGRHGHAVGQVEDCVPGKKTYLANENINITIEVKINSYVAKLVVI